MTDIIDKRFATLRAELALAGFVLVRSTDDHGGPLFIVTREARIEHLAGVVELERFVARHNRRAAT